MTESQANIDCVVCYDPFGDEPALPCGHWVHRDCVQKSADALQEIRASEGYPPIDECICPVCRTTVPDMKPKEAPSVPSMNINVVLSRSEMSTVFQDWERSNYSAPLNWYIWVALSEKYPYEHSEGLIAAAYAFEQMIRMGAIAIDPHFSQPDQRFEQALNRRWRN